MLVGVFKLTLVVGALFASVGTTDLGSSCNGQRLILTDPNGTISDGTSDYYPSTSRCEWLIDGEYQFFKA